MLVYDSSVRCFARFLVLASGLLGFLAAAQECGGSQKLDSGKSEPKYTDTFSGPIVELTAERITVSRSILGKPAERRSFWIKSDTRIEGKLRAKAKVTVGFVTTDDGDIARLIVVRPAQQKAPQEKK